ncbi:MAG: lipid-A-disaccharide synthase, partial [Spirulinaceae cyanobacterium]
MENSTSVTKDILILSNGPGEISTWVRAVVKALRKRFPTQQARISVILSPCPNGTGKEAAIARSYPEVDRVQGAEDFWAFLLWGKTKENWQWWNRGVVLFLGGDQIFPVIIGKRLGYRTIIYAEWEARWYRWVDHFAVMKPEIIANIPNQYSHKCQVVGDLMADVERQNSSGRETELIGLLPGSKSAKLAQGVPLALSIAEYVKSQRPQTRFMIPVAPTLDLKSLGKYANLDDNPVIKKLGNVTAELVIPEKVGQTPYLMTTGGVKIDLITQFPAHEQLSNCRFCLTTVGANTAELASLAIPMIVLIPTNQLEAMRAWDGLPGILA